MKISIIVPVYNVEAYLSRCVKSLTYQTYKDLEIILVDDGSPDNCPKLCDELAQNDDRIIVIHQNNMGLAGARNTGIARATGDYIGFVDSDDWVELDTYEHCVSLIRTYNADIVQFQLGYVYSESDSFKRQKEKIEVYKNKQILQMYMYSTTTGKGGDYSVCVCLFRKELIKTIRFRVGKINEDIDFKYKVFSLASLMVNTNLQMYHYFQQNNGISLGGLCKKDFDLYDAANEIMKLSENEDYGNIRYLVKVKKARTPLSLLCKIAVYGINDSSLEQSILIKNLTRELRNNSLLLIFSPIPFSRKLLCMLFCINYNLAEVCIKLIK